MPSRGLPLFLAAGIAVLVVSPALGQQPTFQDLLTRAKAQAAAGHRWSPAGDNMTETISVMMDLIPTATAEQLSELAMLLETDGAGRQSRSVEQIAPVTPSSPSERVPLADQLAPVKPSSPDEPVPLPVPLAEHDAPAKYEVPAEQPTMQASLTPTVRSDAATPLTLLNSPLANHPVVAPAPPRPPQPNAASTNVTAPVVVPAKPTVVTAPVMTAPAVVPAKPVPLRSSARAADLFTRGQQAEQQGDVSGARRFYAIAAEQGSAAAALGLGRLYDPAYLKRTALGGIDPDPEAARRWYERAVAMGDAQAGRLLEALASR